MTHKIASSRIFLYFFGFELESRSKFCIQNEKKFKLKNLKKFKFDSKMLFDAQNRI